MKKHATMNLIDRLLWSQSLNSWIAAAETAKGGGKKSSRRKLLFASLSLAFTPLAHAQPTGGAVVSGTGHITQTGNLTTIDQTSQNLSLNWQTFNTSAQQTVNFVQPSASAIAVNRIFDANGTLFLGNLNANGIVYVINPNGIIFGQGSQVDVGGLVASTLNISDSSLSSNTQSFSGNGQGSVINRGAITAAQGGFVALIGNHVSNEGVITAQLGTVALGAGSEITLSFSGASLVKIQVDQSTLNNLAENKQLIVAEGGQVIMSAGAKDTLLASVVNNTGIIEARTIAAHDGVISLLGGKAAGTVNAGGTLDASAPNGGNGGNIETSAAQVQVANDAKVTTAAAKGKNGDWLIDSNDFTIAATGGNISGATLATELGQGNVDIKSSSGTTGAQGNLNVNDAVSWKDNQLTLNAQKDIDINANLNATGTAKLALQYGQGAVNDAHNTSNYYLNNGAQVNLPAGQNFSTQLGSDGPAKSYNVITALNNLQGINNGLGNYVLGANIDDKGAEFTPLTAFSGVFDGLGHTISNLNINQSFGFVGLFSSTTPGSLIQNVGLLGGSFQGGFKTGSLVGQNTGTVNNSYATGTVTGFGITGGLIGENAGGTISDSYAAGAVSGISYVGGLAGNNFGTISNSYATGNVSGSNYVGGLTAQSKGTINNSYATGAVIGGSSKIGGLLGFNARGTVSNSFWNTDTSGQANSSGGTGLTTAQMMNITNFTNNNWDISKINSSHSIWFIYPGQTAPLLRHFMTDLTVTANNANKTNDGIPYSGGNGVSYSFTPNNANLLGTLSYAGSAQGAVSDGIYTIQASGFYSNQQGYIIDYVPGSLVVTNSIPPITPPITPPVVTILPQTPPQLAQLYQQKLFGLIKPGLELLEIENGGVKLPDEVVNDVEIK